MQIFISILPFIVLLALWGILMRGMRRGNHATKKNIIDPMDEMLQKTIVPEIQALRQAVESLRAEIRTSSGRL